MNKSKKAGLVLALALLGAVGLTQVWGPDRPQRAHAQGKDTVIDMGSLWNAPAPAISASLFTTNLRTAAGRSGYQAPSAMRITVSLKVTGVLYLVETNGTTTQVTALNSGTALTAFQDFTFVVGLRSFDQSTVPLELKYNFQLGTNGGVVKLRCEELLGGTS